MKSNDPWRIAGLLTLLAAYGVAAALPLASIPFDLFLAGGAGLYLITRWHLKGCAYAVMLLALAGIFGHLFLEESHFLRLGLEASLACSFFATALSFEGEAEELSGLASQLTSRTAAIQNLEEEVGKIREGHVEAQLTLSQKIEELQKNYDEMASEKSSLEILNDVLRKANAAHYNEKKELETRVLEEGREHAAAHRREAELQRELDEVKKSDLLGHNQLLLKELNSARFEKEQTRLINETLVRIEREATIQREEAETRLREMAGEKHSIETQAAALQTEIRHLSEELSKSAAERLQIESRLKEETDQSELLERLRVTEEKIQGLVKIEFLHKQLKSQFEEKNRTLHETRAALFKAETELQTRVIEKEEQNSLFSELLREELARVDEEIGALQSENLELQDLVTHLTRWLPLPPLSFAAHRTPLPAGQPSLEETLRQALIPKKKKKAKKIVKEDLSERLF